MSDLVELIKNQAEYVKQQYADFEALKRIYARESGDVSAFDSFDEAPVSKKKKRSKAPEETYQEQGYQDLGADVSDAWVSYMDKYASGEALYEHKESFPPSLVLCEEDIDTESEAAAYGIPMGIPKEVWVHLPMAGRVLLNDIGE